MPAPGSRIRAVAERWGFVLWHTQFEAEERDMTQQVRKSYRNHRKATWAVVIVLAALIAAVVIPIASGAADKNYTMGFGTVTPTPPTTGNSASSQSLCTDSPYSVQIAIKNTAKTVTLGSANVTFPTNVTLTANTASLVQGGNQASTSTISSAGNLVKLRGLSLPKCGVVTFSVGLTTAAVTGRWLLYGHGGRQAVERLQRLEWRREHL